jgi:hypothetical protein
MDSLGSNSHPRGSMYRPPTREVYDKIRALMAAEGMSFNGTVHMLVVRGLRALEEQQDRLKQNRGHW